MAEASRNIRCQPKTASFSLKWSHPLREREPRRFRIQGGTERGTHSIGFALAGRSS